MASGAYSPAASPSQVSQPSPDRTRSPGPRPSRAASARASSTSSAPVNSRPATARAGFVGLHRREGREPVALPGYLHGVVGEAFGSVREPPAQGAQRQRDPLAGAGAGRVQGVGAAHHQIGGGRVAAHLGDDAGRVAGQQPHGALPVRREQQREPVAGLGGEVALEQVGGLGHPIGEGGDGEFDALARRVVVEGHERAGRIGGERGSQQVGGGAVDGVHARKRTRGAACG